MKKVISLFLSIAMLLSIVSVVDFSAYASVKTGKCGDNLKYSLDRETGTLTISGTGDMYDYLGTGGSFSNSGSPFYRESVLKRIYIENGVTSIGSTMFEYCVNLTFFEIPNSVTSIGDYAFYGCTSLKSVTIPNGVNSIGTYAFEDCTSLTSVTIGNSVTSIGGSAFEDCTSLKSVTIPDSVTSIGSSAFSGCTSLTSVTIRNSVTSIGDYAFYFCDSLTSVTIGNSVTSIGDYAFYNCVRLTSVTIGNSVTSIGKSAFGGCTRLTSVIIGNSVTNIGDYAFYNCTSLESVNYSGTKSQWIAITIGSDNSYLTHAFIKCTDGIIGNGNTVTVDSVKYKLNDDYTAQVISYSGKPKNITISECVSYESYTFKVTGIGDKAFYKCTSLTSVTIPDSVASIGYSAFEDCKSLTSVNYSGTKSQWKSIIFGSYNDELENAIIKCTDGVIGNGNTVTIDNLEYKINNDYTASLVDYKGILKNITISKSVTYEGYTFNVTGIDGAFNGCTSLTSVTIPDSVTNIGNYAFNGCTSLTSVTIPNSVTSIGDSAFSNCTSLTSVTIPDTVTSIGNAFYNCTSLTSVTIPDSVTSIGSAFYNCTSLTSVTIPDSVTSIGSSAFSGCTSLTSVTIPNSVTSIGDYVFKNCTSLTNITIPDSVTRIGKYAFENCTSLTSVTIPDSVISIGDYAFSSCTSLTSVTIPDNVTSIGNSAFEYCTSLTSVTIPNNVTNIGYRSFYDCKSLTSITIGNSVTSIGNSAFEYCTSLTSVTIPNSVTSIGNYTFSDCSNLKSVNYNGTKAQWKSISGYSNVSQIIKCTDGIYANSNTIIVDSVNYKLNDDYTAKVISYSGTPENITILESVTYEGLTFKVTSIGSSAFFGCSKLKKIEIPDSVTYIGSKAFYGTAFYNTVKNWEDGVLYCGNHLISAKSDVTKITVKASTVSIAAGALDNCKSLEKINVLNPKCVINCTIPKTAVIGGAEGSTAEEFAQKNNMSIDYFEECTHSDKVQVVIAATCTEQGAVQSRCADCDKLISQTFTAPLGHTMVITTPAKAPTCTTSGNTQAGYCTVCGYNEVSTVIPATGHNFVNNSANCLACGVANPNYVAPTQPTPSPTPSTTPTQPTPSPTPSTTPTQPNQNDTNTSNDENVTVISKPKSASIKKVKGAKKAVSVEWKKVSGVKGYQVQVATNKKFKKNKKTVTIKKQKTTKTTVKKLKAKKKYYVRVRTYKIVNGKKVYSSWSKVKTVKTK